MAPSAKPPTSLKLSIQIFGNAEQRLDLFAQLEELGFIERSQDIVLNVGYFFEEEGRAARDQAEALLRDHPAVMRTKSFTDLGTKRKISDTLPASPEDEPDEDEDDETPLERYAREQDGAGSSIESVTLTHSSNGQRGRSVRLTADTSERAAEILRQMHEGGE